jgi:hypothetical protein
VTDGPRSPLITWTAALRQPDSGLGMTCLVGLVVACWVPAGPHVERPAHGLLILACSGDPTFQQMQVRLLIGAVGLKWPHGARFLVDR